MKWAIPRLIAPAVLLLSPVLAKAQSQDDPFAMVSEERVVEAASRHEQPVSEAPAEVTVISAEEIARFGWTTLAEVLRSVRGFYVTDDHNYSYAGVRGFSRPSDYNNRLLLMLDGHKLNGAVYEDALIGTELPLDLRALKRIEIIRGPVSALYGTDGIFGAINLVTRDPRAGNAGSGDGSLGSAGLLQGRGYGRAGMGAGTGVQFSVRGFKDSGRDLSFPELATASNPTGTVHGADADRGQGFLFEMQGRQWTLEALYTGRTKHVPTASYNSLPFNTDTYTFDQRGFVELRTARQFSATLGLDARAYVSASHYDAHTWDPPADSGGAPVLDMDLGEGWSAGTELRMSKAVGSAQEVQLGVEGELQPEARQRTYDIAPRFEYINDNHHANRVSLYLQDELTLSPQLAATFALRHDRSYGLGLDGNATNPHLALVYKTGAGTLKLLGGSSFRRPTPYELYYAPAVAGIPQAPLNPEHALGMELAWEEAWGDGGHTVVTAFLDHVHDLIDAVSDGNGNPVMVNRSSARCFGSELECSRPRVLGGSVTGSLVVERSEDQDGQRLSNSPTFLINLRLWHPWAAGRLETALELDHVSSRLTLRDTWVDAVNLLNAHVRFRPLKAPAELDLHVTNLLNLNYSDPSGPEHIQTSLPQYGRSARVALVLGGE